MFKHTTFRSEGGMLVPPSSDHLHPKEPLKVYDISLGRPIADIPRMIYCLLRSMKSKLMVDEAFVIFFLLHLKEMVEARPLMCSEISQNEY